MPNLALFNFTKPAQRRMDSRAPMRSLIQRLSYGPESHSTRIIAFIAARNREGTSTVARNYASALASDANQKVLLIDAGPFVPKRFETRGVDPSIGIVDAIVDKQLPSDAIHPVSETMYISRWVGRDENRCAVGKVLYNTKFWQTLLETFDTLIIDTPSLQTSFDGIMLAAKADATVMVVEAEKTPQPVVRHLRDTLTGAGATIAGVVMNKRRFYIPNRVYKKL